MGQHGAAFVFSDLDSPGHPTYAQMFQADGTPNQNSLGIFCYECHDQLGDGRRLQPGYTGNVDRPVIGCESCHGGGAEHFGVGNIPFPKPGAERCGQCHNQDFDHNKYHPNADNIYEDYVGSPHSRSINDHNYVSGTDEVRAQCGRCHTDEGFRKYAAQVPGTTGHDSIEDFFADKPDLVDASDVTCRTCHDPHEATGENLTRIDADMVNGNTQSSEFNTCTSCHQLVNDEGGVLTADALIMNGSTVLNGDSFAYHDPVINTYGSLEEIISDTHAAVPGDTRLNTGAGAKNLVFIKKGDDHSCAACHNQHAADNTINEAWKESGHGDSLADPWTHYDWKHSGRADCQRCHTATGFMNFADALAGNTTYDPADNDFSYLLGNDDPGPRVDDNDQNESLYCWACHAVESGPHQGEISYKGLLRNPGPFPFQYPAGAMSGETVFPDASGSNVCLACHSGRESGSSVQALTGMTSKGFKNSHYLAAAGILYRSIGYEYYVHEGTPGSTVAPNYSDQSYFKHDLVGMTAAGSTVTAASGTNGPCAGCHMRSAAGVAPRHSFSPLVMDGATEELASPACAACHTTHPMTVEEIEENEDDFQASLAFLEARLAASGYPFLGGYPYFATGDWTLDWQGAGTGSDAVGRMNMGAAFNFNVFKNEPGAFAHNRYYTKRLIYDSIDWLDNNALDQSVAGALTTLATNNPGVLDGATLAEAQAYLIKVSGGKNRP